MGSRYLQLKESRLAHRQPLAQAVKQCTEGAAVTSDVHPPPWSPHSEAQDTLPALEALVQVQWPKCGAGEMLAGAEKD